MSYYSIVMKKMEHCDIRVKLCGITICHYEGTVQHCEVRMLTITKIAL